MPEIKKALPLVTASNRAFWDAARRHELVLYKCQDCGAYSLQEIDCVTCSCRQGAWVPASGRGEIYTFCVYRQSFHPAWEKDIPYNVAYVKLQEGPLLLTAITGCDNKDIHVGMRVAVVYDDINEEFTLPKFRLVK